jgi:hypothetical protein
MFVYVGYPHVGTGKLLDLLRLLDANAVHGVQGCFTHSNVCHMALVMALLVAVHGYGYGNCSVTTVGALISDTA